MAIAEALRLMALQKAQDKRNEPGGEGRVALLERYALHARANDAPYLAVIVDVAGGVPYHDALKAHGLNHVEFMLAKTKHQEIGMIWAQANEMRDANDLQRCRTAFARLLEGDAENPPNVKAVLAGLEHLGGRKWQKGGGAEGGGKGGHNIVYNIQVLHAPRAATAVIGGKKCENSARIADDAEIIEVKE